MKRLALSWLATLVALGGLACSNTVDGLKKDAKENKIEEKAEKATEAADLILKGMDGAIAAKTVTYDFARLMEGAKEVRCSEFGDAVIAHMS